MEVAHNYSYCVETKSKFALFLDTPSLESPEKQPESIKTESSVNDKDSHNVAGTAFILNFVEKQRPVQSKPVRNERSEAPMRGRGRGGRGGDRGRGGFNKPRSDVNFTPNDDMKRDDRPRGRGRGRGRGNGREFDRHSGSDKTGIKPVAKKDGYGTGNWGTVEDEIEATMSPVNEVAEVTNESVEEEEETPAAPPEPENLTLAEYKARKSGVMIAHNESRAPNDGKDVFKNMVKRKEPSRPQEVLEMPKQSQPDQKETDLNLELKFVDSKQANFRGGGADRRPNRGRGGARGSASGRGRGRGGAPANRGSHSNDFSGNRNGNRSGAAPPSLNNDKDFPSLH